MKTESPEKLLVKLTRAADQLRWFLWLEKHQAGVLWTERGVSVSADVGDRFVMGEGKTLPEAMAAVERDLAGIQHQEAERRRWARMFGREVQS